MGKLTESAIKKAQILEKQYKIYDGEGMFLLVHPNGSKYWRMKYTYDGKSKLASFGVWPGISLKQARDRRHDAKQKIEMGINPVNVKRKNKVLLQKDPDIKVTKEPLKDNKHSPATFQWSNIVSKSGKISESKSSIHLLKSRIFGGSAFNSISLSDKQERNEIFSRIYRNRNELYHIIWENYLNFPILNIAVLFIILITVMDSLPAIIITILYFIFKVFATVALSLWKEKNKNENHV
tara:strand:+ start:130 stop:840 length:711 start_codon:yes stop_codon:yes gene_type:complete